MLAVARDASRRLERLGLTKRRVQVGIEATFLALAVWAYLRVGPHTPAPATASVDNSVTMKHIAAIANGEAVAVWADRATDPWLRYVPPAIVAALLPLGHITLREASMVMGWYVLLAEALTYPAAAYLLARQISTRAAATLTTAIYAGVRLATHTFRPQYIEGARIEWWLFGGSLPYAVRALNVVRNLIPDTVYFVILGPLILTAVVGLRAGLRASDDRRQLAGIVIGGLAVSVLVLKYKMFFHVLAAMWRSYVVGEHHYLAYAQPWALLSFVAVVRARLTDSTRWAVAGGALLGVAGSIQLGIGAFAAITVATVYAYGRDWRGLVTTALASMLVALPNAIVFILHTGAYRRGGRRVMDQTPDVWVIVAVAGIVAWIVARGPRLLERRDSPLVPLVAGAWLGVTVVGELFWWWQVPAAVATHPLAVLVSAVVIWRLSTVVKATRRSRQSALG